MLKLLFRKNSLEIDMKNLFIMLFLTLAPFLLAACGDKPAANAPIANAATDGGQNAPEGECAKSAGEPEKAIESPVEAYTFLFEAVKAKNTDKIKQISSEGSRQLAQFMAGTYKKPCEETYKNGFTETTFNEKMPETRDVQIKDEFATIEVKDAKGMWQMVPFIKQGNGWKVAFGELYFGKFKQPGPTLSFKEGEAANAKAGNRMINAMANVNTNVQIKKIEIPDAAPPAK